MYHQYQERPAAPPTMDEYDSEWSEEFVKVADVRVLEGSAEQLREVVCEHDRLYDSDDIDVTPDLDATLDLDPEDAKFSIEWDAEGVRAKWRVLVDVEEFIEEWRSHESYARMLGLCCNPSSWNGKRNVERQVTASLAAYLMQVECHTPHELYCQILKWDDFARDREVERERAELKPKMGRLLEAAQTAAQPISTGLDALDEVLGGGLHVGVTVVAGDPSAGKTALACQIALSAAHDATEGDHPQRVGVVELDMGGESAAALRMLSLSAKIQAVIDGQDAGCELWRAHSWTDAESRRALDAYARLSRENVVLMDEPELDALLEGLDRITRKADVSWRLVVVDSIQLVRGDGVTVATDPTFAIQALSQLRQWAYAHRTAVLLCSEFTKDSSDRHRAGKEPVLTDVLGSAEIGYSAESVLALTNMHDGSGHVRIQDLKPRHGAGRPQSERVCTLTLDAAHGYFE